MGVTRVVRMGHTVFQAKIKRTHGRCLRRIHISPQFALLRWNMNALGTSHEKKRVGNRVGSHQQDTRSTDRTMLKYSLSCVNTNAKGIKYLRQLGGNALRSKRKKGAGAGMPIIPHLEEQIIGNYKI